MTVVSKVKKFVFDECKKPSSKYGLEPFNNHFAVVVDYAKKLATQKGADIELVSIAAWLHDIGAIIDGREDHHRTGAKIAEKVLISLEYPQDKIDLVKKCIIGHRSSKNFKRRSLAEKIVAEADALSSFDNVPGIFMASYLFEKKNQKQARKEVIRKTKRKWAQLEFPQSRKMVAKKYQAILELFDY